MAQRVAIAMTTSATQCLSVVIATFGGLRRNSDAFSAVGITTLICALNTNTKLICMLHKNDFIVLYPSQ